MNKKIWLSNSWFKGWNNSKTAFAIHSPWNQNGLIWFYKSYYIESKYNGWFGIEINITNYKTNKEHIYQEIIYALTDKKINYIKGINIFNYFDELNTQSSEKYRRFINDFNSKKDLN